MAPSLVDSDIPTSRASQQASVEPADVVVAKAKRVFPPNVVAVDDVDLHIEKGSFVAFLGPSGCGKSTLLRMIAGLDRPTSGGVLVGGEDPSLRTVPIAFVFQDAHLLPWRNVLDNAALPLELLGVPKAERHHAASLVLRDVGLGDAQFRIPSELSGGMRMRVSLARALITSPRVLLLDEPFAALDELTRNRLDDRLRAIWRERRTTVIFVTHSITEASYLAERAIVFSKRPARIVLDRKLELPSLRTPKLRGDAAFAREVSLLHEALEVADA